MTRDSISRRLARGLAIVGFAGAAGLLIFIFLDYHLSFGGLADPAAFTRAWHEIAAHVLLPLVMIAAPMTLAALWIIGRALAPIERAVADIAAAGDGAPGQRVDVTGFPDEVRQLADSVNVLLARQEAAAGRHAAFACDIAHELRTPLTLLGLELGRDGGVDTDSMRRQVRRMRKLVEQLMLLARLESGGSEPPGDERVELAGLAADVVAELAPHAVATGRRLQLEDLGAKVVPGRHEALAAALRNLVDNALRVTPRTGTVTVTAGPGCRLAVRDGGPGLAPEQLARLLGRHVRADSASHDGAGLGLAIVERIVGLHQGELSTDPLRSTIAIRLPDRSCDIRTMPSKVNHSDHEKFDETTRYSTSSHA